MALTFSGPTLNIALDARTDLNVTDMYSRWKDWVKTGDNAKYPPAFSSTGGDDIVAGVSKIPHYAFLTNEWRISPQEADYTLNVITGILLVFGGGDPFIDTVGAFTVRVNYQQPVQGISVGIGEIEPGVGNIEATRLMLAALVGKLSGAPGPGTITIRDIMDSKNRIQATVDINGNRTSVTMDMSE